MRDISDNIPCDLFVQATKLFTTKSTQITVYHIWIRFWFVFVFDWHFTSLCILLKDSQWRTTTHSCRRTFRNTDLYYL